MVVFTPKSMLRNKAAVSSVDDFVDGKFESVIADQTVDPAAVRKVLLFGAGHPARKEGRIVTIQSVGSSGGLKVGADFIKRYFPDSSIYVSDPTWDNHRAVFELSLIHI